jgi:hypothetical protein
MLRIEQNHGGLDIRDLIVSAMSKMQTGREVAEQFGIAESNLSHWQHQLGIADEIAMLRQAKRLQLDPALLAS